MDDDLQASVLKSESEIAQVDIRIPKMSRVVFPIVGKFELLVSHQPKMSKSPFALSMISPPAYQWSFALGGQQSHDILDS